MARSSQVLLLLLLAVCAVQCIGRGIRRPSHGRSHRRYYDDYYPRRRSSRTEDSERTTTLSSVTIETEPGDENASNGKTIHVNGMTPDDDKNRPNFGSDSGNSGLLDSPNAKPEPGTITVDGLSPNDDSKENNDDFNHVGKLPNINHKPNIGEPGKIKEPNRGDKDSNNDDNTITVDGISPPNNKPSNDGKNPNNPKDENNVPSIINNKPKPDKPNSNNGKNNNNANDLLPGDGGADSGLPDDIMPIPSRPKPARPDDKYPSEDKPGRDKSKPSRLPGSTDINGANKKNNSAIMPVYIPGYGNGVDGKGQVPAFFLSMINGKPTLVQNPAVLGGTGHNGHLDLNLNNLGNTGLPSWLSLLLNPNNRQPGINGMINDGFSSGYGDLPGSVNWANMKNNSVIMPVYVPGYGHSVDGKDGVPAFFLAMINGKPTLVKNPAVFGGSGQNGLFDLNSENWPSWLNLGAGNLFGNGVGGNGYNFLPQMLRFWQYLTNGGFNMGNGYPGINLSPYIQNEQPVPVPVPQPVPMPVPEPVYPGGYPNYAYPYPWAGVNGLPNYNISVSSPTYPYGDANVNWPGLIDLLLNLLKRSHPTYPGPVVKPPPVHIIPPVHNPGTPPPVVRPPGYTPQPPVHIIPHVPASSPTPPTDVRPPGHTPQPPVHIIPHIPGSSPTPPTDVRPPGHTPQPPVHIIPHVPDSSPTPPTDVRPPGHTPQPPVHIIPHVPGSSPTPPGYTPQPPVHILPHGPGSTSQPLNPSGPPNSHFRDSAEDNPTDTGKPKPPFRQPPTSNPLGPPQHRPTEHNLQPTNPDNNGNSDNKPNRYPSHGIHIPGIHIPINIKPGSNEPGEYDPGLINLVNIILKQPNKVQPTYKPKEPKDVKDVTALEKELEAALKPHTNDKHLKELIALLHHRNEKNHLNLGVISQLLMHLIDRNGQPNYNILVEPGMDESKRQNMMLLLNLLASDIASGGSSGYYESNAANPLLYFLGHFPCEHPNIQPLSGGQFGLQSGLWRLLTNLFSGGNGNFNNILRYGRSAEETDEGNGSTPAPIHFDEKK